MLELAISTYCVSPIAPVESGGVLSCVPAAVSPGWLRVLETLIRGAGVNVKRGALRGAGLERTGEWPPPRKKACPELEAEELQRNCEEGTTWTALCGTTDGSAVPGEGSAFE
jgi:hypothetical protein